MDYESRKQNPPGIAYQLLFSSLIFSSQGGDDIHFIAALMETGAEQPMEQVAHHGSLDSHAH